MYAFCTHKRLHENEYSEKQVFGLKFLPLAAYSRRDMPFPSFLGHIMWKLLYVGTLMWKIYFSLSEHKGGRFNYCECEMFPENIPKRLSFLVRSKQNLLAE